MRIAYFSDTFYPQLNGVVTSILNSSRILAERGNKVCIFTIASKEVKKLRLHKNIEVVYYRSIDAFKYPGFELVIPKTIHCIKKIKEFKPDIIHIHAPTILGWEGVICGKIFKIPIVGTYHTLVPDFLKHSPIPKIGEYEITKKAAWKYTNKFHEKCNITITPSLAMKKELIKHGLKTPIKAVSNGVNLKLFYPRKKNNKKFRILYLGRISYEKNIDVVLKAVAEFSNKANRKDFEFWVVGSGPDLESLKKLAEKLGINKFTKFTGPIQNKDIPEIYSNSDVFVTASTIETEGIVLLEAMACGLPIIGVNARAIPYIVKDYENGFIVNAGDYEKIGDAINKIYNNNKLRKNMKKNCIKSAKEYDAEKCIDKIVKIYKRLIKKS